MERHIGRAIQSVRSQTLADWELLIIDDASTDNSLALARSSAAEDPRIRIIESPSNRGPSAARNRGIAEARGEWIALLDADDTYGPGRLMALKNAGEAEGAAFVADNQFLFDDAMQQVSGIALGPGSVGREISFESFVRSERPGSPFKFGLLKPLMRKSFLETHGLRYREDVRFAEDFYLYAEMLLSGAKAVYVDEPHYYYTTQVGHVSGEKSAATKTVFAPGLRAGFPAALLQKYGAAMSPGARTALADYGRWNRAAQFDLRLRQLKEDGRPLAAAATVLSHPNLAVRSFLRPLVRSLRRRV